MKNPIKMLKDSNARKGKQKEIMGEDYHRQERIQLKGKNAAKDTIQRVSDYKAAKLEKAPKMVKKMAKGGLCRGMGAATKGGFKGSR